MFENFKNLFGNLSSRNDNPNNQILTQEDISNLQGTDLLNDNLIATCFGYDDNGVYQCVKD